MRLPVTLPMTIGDLGGDTVVSYQFQLPVTLPLTIRMESGGRLTTRVIYSETPQGVVHAIPFFEVPWDFQGLVLEENVIGQMHSQLVLIEDVKGRIFAECMLLNYQDILVSWYGDYVPRLSINVKMSIDEDYTKLGEWDWDEKQGIISIGTDEYNVLLEGTNNEGLSNIITIGESTYNDLITNLTTANNEKIFDIEVHLTSRYHINVYL